MYTNRNPFGGNQFGNQNPFDDLLKKKKEKEKEPEAYDPIRGWWRRSSSFLP